MSHRRGIRRSTLDMQVYFKMSKHCTRVHLLGANVIHGNHSQVYLILDFDLHRIVQEVRSLKFNVEQEQEIVLRNIRGANISETMFANNTIYAKTGDVLSTLMNLEKVEFQSYVK